MKMKDIKKLDIPDIAKQIGDLRTTLRKNRFGSEGSRAKNVKERSGQRKDVARLLTELRTRAK